MSNMLLHVPVVELQIKNKTCNTIMLMSNLEKSVMRLCSNAAKQIWMVGNLRPVCKFSYFNSSKLFSFLTVKWMSSVQVYVVSVPRHGTCPHLNQPFKGLKLFINLIRHANSVRREGENRWGFGCWRVFNQTSVSKFASFFSETMFFNQISVRNHTKMLLFFFSGSHFFNCTFFVK